MIQKMFLLGVFVCGLFIASNVQAQCANCAPVRTAVKRAATAPVRVAQRTRTAVRCTVQRTRNRVACAAQRTRKAVACSRQRAQSRRAAFASRCRCR